MQKHNQLQKLKDSTNIKNKMVEKLDSMYGVSKSGMPYLKATGSMQSKIQKVKDSIVTKKKGYKR